MTKTTLTFKFENKQYDPLANPDACDYVEDDDHDIRWFLGEFVAQHEDGSVDLLALNGSETGHVFTYYRETDELGPLILVTTCQ